MALTNDSASSTAKGRRRRMVMDIVEQSVAELYGLADDHRAHKGALREAFSGAHVDRAEIERIRGAEIELADAASRQLTSAITEIAEILSPAQWETLLERVSEHHHSTH